MCKYCEGEFFGEKDLVPIGKMAGGMELIVDGGFLYSFCSCGRKLVAEIHFCPMCGKDLDQAAV